MKAKELNEMTAVELNALLKSKREELFNLRFSHATGQLNNPMQMVNCKKDIARVKTVIRQREIKNELKAAKKVKA